MMKDFTKRSATAALALATLAALAGCGNVSRNVAKDGQGAGELVWPATSDTTPMHRDGTSPTLDSVRNVQAGQNKQQVAALIGYPHFSEGVFGVREWNYVFHLRAPGSDAETLCQYKVLFDEHMLARSFYWKPASCADLLKPPAKPAQAAGQRYSLSADTLFAFDKSDITAQGREALDKLASRIAADGGKPGMVHVLGYTDRLGSESHNERLSRQRAHAVVSYLVQHGVPSSAIVAEGRGSLAPVSSGCEDGGRAALIACLAPDRRVEVVAGGQPN